MTIKGMNKMTIFVNYSELQWVAVIRHYSECIKCQTLVLNSFIKF